MQDGFNRGGTATTSPSGSPTKTLSGTASAHQARLQRFLGELQSNNISLSNLKALAFHGIPDKKGLRALTWKLLLGYLPVDASQWDRVLAQKRASYEEFCKEVIIDPKASNGALGAMNDHPLSQHSDSRWNAFFQDAEILEQIDRDVMRTHPDMHFFSGDDPSAVQHRQEMKRALFVFAKLNPGLRYVQGMNELLAPLYYHFRSDPLEAHARHAEADAFFCFMDLISEFRDNFCQQLDNSDVGIRAMLTRLESLLEQADAELWHHLQVQNKVNPQFYAFRWITLLLTQEFPFPDAVRLWDTLLSDTGGRSNCLLRLCIAMLINVRTEILQGDFAHNLKLLQRYPPVDVHAILEHAAQLQK